MEKYEGYAYFSTVTIPGDLMVPEDTDINLWAEFFKQLVCHDLMAPISLCTAMICFDMYDCVPDTPYRRFYFELGLEILDAEKEYIYDGAMNAGLIQRGVSDIVTYAASGVVPDYEEGLRKAIQLMFEEQTYFLHLLSDDQLKAAHRFAYPNL